jgi:hypothetical protein
MVDKVGDSQIIVNLPVTSVPRCTGSNSKRLGLKHMQFPDTGTSGGPQDWSRLVHHWTDKPFVQRNIIPDGETTSAV